MVLDRDSGPRGGALLKGRYAERSSPRCEAELLRLRDEIAGTDSQGAALLEAYRRRALQRMARAKVRWRLEGKGRGASRDAKRRREPQKGLQDMC